ncbi:M48 family metalloprotease [Bartonella tribocorum]|uniref:Peptidase n=1 Tax=Bartonella tribocorum (strain DSM 28219 / CCUG 45778 / CIP 105476 / IBS 506) TaxID=382640 RepID=A9IYV0_BART1|nr:M48 family metalloprotease [Bartonella tribocorum]CAK02426.1 putative peptidase [Bartonella tribocorum CIP 105476]CDO49764.1 peptidase, M48 family [Bartonella tribocorum]
MKFAKLHRRDDLHCNPNPTHAIAQRNFLFRSLPYKVTFISFMLLLSACHTHLSQNDRLSSSSSETTKHTNNHNIYVTLSALQHPRILQMYGGVYHNAKLERFLAKIIRKLTIASHHLHQSYFITILNSESVNAFALPNGSIYITRGMLALANDSSEVAAILAHEMAHIRANHGILRLQKEAQLKMANHMSPHLLSSMNKKLHPPLKNKQQLAQFSRNQELEADSLALEMLQQAGYDSFALPRFLQTMEAYSHLQNISGTQNAPLDFLTSHPTTPQRIRLAIEKARKISKDNHKIIDRDSFFTSIDGMTFGGSFDTGFLRGNQFIHPQWRIAFSVPNNFTIEHSAQTVWASGPDKIAIRFDVVPHPAGISVSDYLKSGWIIGLDSSSIRPLTIQGLPNQEFTRPGFTHQGYLGQSLLGAQARATHEQWQFDVVVILFNNYIFRFLTAAPYNSPNFAEIAQKTVQSFHPLSTSQLKKLKPLKIRVVRVKQGENIANLANKMQHTPDKEKLFRILNALSPTQALSAGTKVKIITE